MNEKKAFKKTNLIVVTGGPGAGKTAILEMLKKILHPDAVILPEAASIIFNGGFWRLPSLSAKTAAQKAIFHVQSEMENLVSHEGKWSLALCDRGSLDGLAYWPKSEAEFFIMGKTTIQKELEKYYAVIHLRSPSELMGYNHVNPLRIETAIQSKVIDEKIGTIWCKHPRYIEIESTENFLEKAQIAIDLITKYSNDLCKQLI